MVRTGVMRQAFSMGLFCIDQKEMDEAIGRVERLKQRKRPDEQRIQGCIAAITPTLRKLKAGNIALDGISRLLRENQPDKAIKVLRILPLTRASAARTLFIVGALIAIAGFFFLYWALALHEQVGKMQ